METFLSFHFQVFVWPQRFLGEFLAQESHREVILALGKKEPLLKRKSLLEIVPATLGKWIPNSKIFHLSGLKLQLPNFILSQLCTLTKFNLIFFFDLAPGCFLDVFP